MSVLTKTTILKLLNQKSVPPLIEDFENASLQGASYDMRLGAAYIKEGKELNLTDENPTLVIEPGDFVVLSTFEKINMPLNLIGHNGIMSPWAKRGIVSLFSPQIDPGFSGFLIVPVFNAGDASISISFKNEVFTVEFVKTDKAAPDGWAQRFGPQNKMPAPASPNAVRPNLIDIKKSEHAIEEMNEKLKVMDAQIKEFEKEVSYLKGVQSGKSILTSTTRVWLAVISAFVALLYFIFKPKVDGFLQHIVQFFG